MCFTSVSLENHNLPVRDHLIQSSHLRERQSPGCSLHLLMPCPRCSLLSLGPPGQGHSLPRAGGTHSNEDATHVPIMMAGPMGELPDAATLCTTHPHVAHNAERQGTRRWLSSASFSLFSHGLESRPPSALPPAGPAISCLCP